MLKRLQERKESRRSATSSTAWARWWSASSLVLAGIVLSGPGVPGPGFVVILLGLGLLALEFEPAEKLLEKVIIWSDKLKDRVQAASTAEKGHRGDRRRGGDRRLRVLGGLLRHPAGAGALKRGRRSSRGGLLLSRSASRSSTRRILPVSVLGRSSTNSISRG